jgi:spermidine dehydrogenase
LVKNPFSLWGESDASPAARATLWKHFNADAPLNDKAKADVKRLYSLNDDLLPGLSDIDKKTRLAKMSYADYLTILVKADPQVMETLRPIIHAWYGVGIEAVPAQDAWGIGLPGFDGLKLAPSPGPGMGRDAIRWNQEAKDYFFHFPDGNASVARLLVRNLIPEAIPGNTADDIVTAQVDYSELDQAKSPIRIRLNSTAVRVRHLGDVSTAKEVEVSYVEQDKLSTARAAHCVLACWNSMIPYLSTELPDKQAQAMASAEKVPLVYTNVVIRNWESWVKLSVDSIYAPAGYFSHYSLDMPVSIGKYQCTKRPDEPIVIHMQRVPCAPGLPAREQHRRGRANLYATSFEVFERNIRELLLRSLGAGGFDPARDVAAITVNRWPHGYAYHYNSLYDSFWMDGGPLPCVIARQPYGRVAIANADSDAFAYTHVAIEQAHRAIDDLGIQVRAA